MSIDAYEENLQKIFQYKFSVVITEYALHLLRANFRDEDVNYIVPLGSNKKQTAARLQQSVTVETTLNNIIELDERGLSTTIYGRVQQQTAYDILALHFELLPSIVLEDMWGLEFKSEGHKKIAKYGDDLWNNFILRQSVNKAQMTVVSARDKLNDKLSYRNVPPSRVPIFHRKAEQQKNLIENINIEFPRKPFKDIVRDIEIEVRRRSTFIT